MKMIKLIYPLAFALAVTLTTTGCHNHQAQITPLHGPAPTARSTTKTILTTIPSAPPFNPDDVLSRYRRRRQSYWDFGFADV